MVCHTLGTEVKSERKIHQVNPNKVLMSVELLNVMHEVISVLCRKIGRDKCGRFSKKVVVSFRKLGVVCVAKGTEIWSLVRRKVRNFSKENNVVSVCVTA